jgi:hypothetical protein
LFIFIKKFNLKAKYMPNNLLIIPLILANSIAYTQISTLNRPDDPVVLTGNQLSAFSTLQPSQIVGFKFVSGTWTQIPIQVDERALLDIVTPYGPLAAQAGYPPSPSNPKVIFYTDATTHTGADPNPAFDNDDELVFMARDAGGQSDGSSPAGIVAGTCNEIVINDPLGGIGYIYLFQNDGSLQQDAGLSYVSYNSNLVSTPGFPVNMNITNVENTVITTPKYSWRFSAEWVSDEFKLLIGNNSNLLDRYKNFFADGNCIRHEDAFSAAQNAYVTIKSGPIRVIRSYMGAVSGPLTQRTHWFYEGRQDIATDLRVHNIVSIIDAFDYTSNANGMIYRNNLNTNGVTINGQPDVVTLGALNWEQVSGSQGTISILHRLITDMVIPTDGNLTSYYDDNAANPASNCTGDGQAWGTSGVRATFTGSICTDPMGSGCANTTWFRNFQARRTVYVDAPNAAATTASTYDNQFNNPLITSVSTCQTVSNFTVSISQNPTAGGTSTGTGTYADGSQVTITATPNSGYAFIDWSENGNQVSTDATYTFTISADRNFLANFDAITTGIEYKDQGLALRVYPNPSSGRVFIDAPFNGELSLFNYLGQHLQTITFTSAPVEITIDVIGVYFLLLRDEFGNTSSSKFNISK